MVVFSKIDTGKKIGLTSSFLILCLLLASCGLFKRNETKGSITLVNMTPFKASIVIAFPVNQEKLNIHGWYQIEAGETLTLHHTFIEQAPEYFVFAQSSEPELVRWVYSLAPETEATLYWEADDLTGMISNEVMNWTIDLNEQPEYSGNAYLAGFARAKTSGKDNSFSFILNDQNLTPESLDTNNFLEVAKQLLQFQMLNSSLKRSVAFEKRWQGKVLPYDLGLGFEDSNGPLALGVSITQVEALLPEGYPSRFQEGDELISMSSKPIFGIRDIASLLIEHAVDRKRGIKVAIPFQVKRGESIVSDITSYWFVREYFAKEASKKGTAALIGLADGISLGNYSTARASLAKLLGGTANLLKKLTTEEGEEPDYIDTPDFSEMKWQFDQQAAAHKQWNQESYAAGGFASFFVGTGQALIKGVGRRGMKKFAGSVSGRVTLEVTENIIWTLNDGNPMRKPEDIAKDLKITIPLSVGGSMFSAVLRKK